MIIKFITLYKVQKSAPLLGNRLIDMNYKVIIIIVYSIACRQEECYKLACDMKFGWNGEELQLQDWWGYEFTWGRCVLVSQAKKSPVSESFPVQGILRI